MILTQSNSLAATDITAVIIAKAIAPSGHTIEGEHLDNAYTFDDVTNKELKMTLQSVLKAGHIPQMKNLSITLLPNTSSWRFFNDIYQAEEASNTTIEIQSLAFTVPSMGVINTFTNGFMVTAKLMPDVKKILQEGTFKFTFGNFVSVSL